MHGQQNIKKSLQYLYTYITVESHFKSNGTTAHPCTLSYPPQGPNFYFSFSCVETEMCSINWRFSHCYECWGNALVCTCTAST